jgi:hypothetical protein
MGGAELRAPGVRVVTGAPALRGYRGLYLLRLGDGCTIGAPDDIAAEVRERVTGLDVHEVYTRAGAERLAGDAAALVLGPSAHAYLDADSFVPPPPCDARRLGPRDVDIVASFRAELDPEEWHEGGFVDELDGVVWGAFEDGRLVAMGNMTDFDGAPADVGIVTPPSARGRGVGTALCGAMIADALRVTPVIRYRALETNVASMRIAAKLGSVGDGGNIAVRLRA